MKNLVQHYRKSVAASPLGTTKEMERIAKATRISVRTLHNLYYGVTEAMHYDKMTKLERYYGRSKETV